MSSQRESLTSSFNDFSSRLLLLEVEHRTDRTSTIYEPATFLGIEGRGGDDYLLLYLGIHIINMVHRETLFQSIHV